MATKTFSTKVNGKSVESSKPIPDVDDVFDPSAWSEWIRDTNPANVRKIIRDYAIRSLVIDLQSDLRKCNSAEDVQPTATQWRADGSLTIVHFPKGAMPDAKQAAVLLEKGILALPE